MLIPTPEQEQAIEQILASPTHSALNASDLGTGKTLVGVEVALRSKAATVLVTCPLNVRYDWEATVGGQSNGAVAPRFITNKTVGGRAAFADLQAGVPGFYLMGRELFRRMPWDSVKRINLVIHDEAAPMANRKNRSFKVAEALATHTDFTLCQSATWYGSDFGNAWGIGRILFPDQVPRSYWAWVYQYTRRVPDRFNKTGEKIVGEMNPGAFAGTFPCYVNLRAKASEPPLVKEIYLDLTPPQRRGYDQFQKKGVLFLEGNPLVAKVPGVINARLRQLTLGEVEVTDTDEIDPKTGLRIQDVDFAPNGRSAKFEALQEMLADLPGEKVLIATDSARFARWVAARLPRAYAWTGQESAADREAAKQRFINGDLDYLIATQGAIGEGVNGLQQVCHIMIELSGNYRPDLNTQMIGRLARRGQTKRVLVYRLLARRTRDDKQNETLLDKMIRMRESTLKEAA